MLIISDSILEKEIKKIEKKISRNDIIRIAQKVKRGLGITLKKEQDWNVIKIKSATKQSAVRAVFF